MSVSRDIARDREPVVVASMLLRGANVAARRLKGADYELDATISPLALAEIAVRRTISIIRGAIRSTVLASGTSRCLFIHRDVQIRTPRQVRIGKAVTIGRGSVIDGLSVHGVDIGGSVNIGAYTIIEATGVITDLGEGFTIGSRSAIGSFSFVGAAGGVRIGSDVIMGNRVSFHSENHRFDDANRPIRTQGVTRLGIEIGDDCWVGANTLFLDGATLGEGCVVAAGSVVRGEIPPFSVVAGVPAKVVRSRRDP